MTKRAWAVAVVAAALTFTTPPAAAEDGTFGVHNHGIGYGATVAPAAGGVRLWDTGTLWRDLNPHPGVWRWDRLDRAVDAAGDREIVLTLGQTPPWAVAGDEPGTGIYGPGAGDMPTEAAWTGYVTAVATRYAGRIDAYEVWNEAETPLFSSMSPEQVARLQHLAYRAVKAVDPAARVLTPGVVLRAELWPAFYDRFAQAGGFDHADAVAVHAYPPPRDPTPERAVALIVDARDRLRSLGVRLPIWDTEINFTSGVMAPAQQAAYLVRTLVLHRAAGVRHVYWYSTPADDLSVKVHEAGPPMRAFRKTRRWLRGRPACAVGRSGRYTCAVPRGVIRWHPADTDLLPLFLTHRQLLLSLRS